jgi:YfiH family protein
MRQVHGRTIVKSTGTSEGEGINETPPEGDIAIAAAVAPCVAAVQVADCVPILVADARTGAVAAAHAGWRGLSVGVPGVTVRALVEQLGSDRSDLIAATGPSIGACCYEVGPEVADAFRTGQFSTADLDRWFLSVPRAPRDHASLVTGGGTRRGDRQYFDGWTSVEDQLVTAGVRRERIFMPHLCTGGHSSLLCSYRRDGARAGRMAAAIRTPASRPHLQAAAQPAR